MDDLKKDLRKHIHGVYFGDLAIEGNGYGLSDKGNGLGSGMNANTPFGDGFSNFFDDYERVDEFGTSILYDQGVEERSGIGERDGRGFGMGMGCQEEWTFYVYSDQLKYTKNHRVNAGFHRKDKQKPSSLLN